MEQSAKVEEKTFSSDSNTPSNVIDKLESIKASARFALRDKLQTVKEAVKNIEVKEDFSEDVEFVRQKLKETHPNLFFRYPESDFNRDMDQLKAEAVSMSREQFVIKLQQDLAKFRDRHLMAWIYDVLNFDQKFPINIRKMEDGYYVVAVAKKYEDLLGQKVIQLGDETGFGKLISLIPQETSTTTNAMISEMIINSKLLKTLGISKNDSLDLLVEDKTGVRSEVRIESHDREHRPEFTSFRKKLQEVPLAKKNRDLPYWYEFVNGNNTVYLQYNMCIHDYRKFAELVNDMRSNLDNSTESKIILDLRNNHGGSAVGLLPLEEFLTGEINKYRNPGFGKGEEIGDRFKGRIFILTSAETFSAAVINANDLRKKCGAKIVGEMPSGCIGSFVDVTEVELPKSSIKVFVESRRRDDHKGPDYMNEVIPDIQKSETVEDMSIGRDPALEYAIKE